VTVDREALLAHEAEGWRALQEALDPIPDDRYDEPTVTPEGWSVKDTLFHVGWWLDDCGRVLEAIAAGTWDPAEEPEETPDRVRRVNAEHVARAAAMGADEVATFLAAARERARTAFAALPEITPDAWQWFEESGPMHYAKHVHDLRAWVEGASPDPEVGDLLDAETHAWLTLATAISRIPDEAWDAAAQSGWTPTTLVHHLAAWCDVAAGGVERNRYWTEDGAPASDALLDEMNADFLAQARGAGRAEVLDALGRARARLRAALAALPSPSPEAKRTFAANTVHHFDEHLEDLQPFLSGGPQARG
jgi:hypothetical protein